MDISIGKKIWLPDIEILDIHKFRKLHVISDLESFSVEGNNIEYAVGAEFSVYCRMYFQDFPHDEHECLIQMLSKKIDQIEFKTAFIPDLHRIRNNVDFALDIKELDQHDRMFITIEGMTFLYVEGHCIQLYFYY